MSLLQHQGLGGVFADGLTPALSVAGDGCQCSLAAAVCPSWTTQQLLLGLSSLSLWPWSSSSPSSAGQGRDLCLQKPRVALAEPPSLPSQLTARWECWHQPERGPKCPRKSCPDICCAGKKKKLPEGKFEEAVSDSLRTRSQQLTAQPHLWRWPGCQAGAARDLPCARGCSGKCQREGGRPRDPRGEDSSDGSKLCVKRRCLVWRHLRKLMVA